MRLILNPATQQIRRIEASLADASTCRAEGIFNAGMLGNKLLELSLVTRLRFNA